MLACLHIALIIQKINKGQSGNKGRTVLIFDKQDEYQYKVAGLINMPPPFIDEYVKFEQKNEIVRLSQIIDTAFFVDSQHSAMAQLADVVSFFTRLYIEYNCYGRKEEDTYIGEKAKITSWVNKIKDKIVGINKVFPRGKTGFVGFLNQHKPPNIDSCI